MSKRIYAVTDQAGGISLIKTTNKSSAIRTVAEKTIKAEVATQDQLVTLIGAGHKVQEVGEVQGEPE